MSTTQAGLDAAYATEINNCEFRANAGPKKQARPAEFCQSITVQGATTLVGAMAATNVAIAGKASFEQPIEVQGQSFKPVLVNIPGVGLLTVLAVGVPASG